MYQLCSSSNLLVGNDVIGASMFSLLAYESVRVFWSVRFDWGFNMPVFHLYLTYTRSEELIITMGELTYRFQHAQPQLKVLKTV